jgi:DNA helicase-2/ATP-dependent DNA helicase PcrA
MATSKREYQTGFEAAYQNLNTLQKKAVDAIEGPVMVVAGPGTGKTQVLALRIANILNKTDIKGDGVLCLTFTNSAVEAMKKRLKLYMGEAGETVQVYTFHSFGMKVIEEHFQVLGSEQAPRLMEDTERAMLFDRILAEQDWAYLRPRGNSMKYFYDLKSLISLLKRERISEEDFEARVAEEIEFLQNDEGSISSRGATKGEIKKEVKDTIESLEKTKEIAKFMRIYESEKKSKNVLDYDDVLESLVKIVEKSQDARDNIRERYLYVLVDEHQDSSRVQNEFLTRVWAEVDRPDIFVVGDDRQLIYGFSGASIEHFANFSKTFKGAELIPLTDNYRSTQVILDASHALLQSVMSKERLVSQSQESHPIKLIEAATPRQEIISAALDIKKKIKEGVDPNDVAILVPKNKQVRNALDILYGLGVQVATIDTLDLFHQAEANAFLRVLKIIANKDKVALAASFFDRSSGITPLEASRFIISQYMKEFSVDAFLDVQDSLFVSHEGGDVWRSKLSKWMKDKDSLELRKLIETVGGELFLEEKDSIVSGSEITDTFLSLCDKELERNPDITLQDFVLILEKLGSFGEYIPVITKGADGVKVLTMHSSKGLEFDYVWIAHMDERSLGSGKRMSFALPEKISAVVEERDTDSIKRKLYVAITRAKRFCTLSYSTLSTKGGDQHLAQIIEDLPEEVFKKEKIDRAVEELSATELSAIAGIARGKYQDRFVSVSLLNNFFECPWKWFFENLLQLPKEKAEVLEFGSMVHSLLDSVLKMNVQPSLEDTLRLTMSEVEKSGLGTARERQRMTEEVSRIVFRWAEARLQDIKSNRKTEESISIKDPDYPHLKIYGKIDLIENLGGREASEVRVTDFKTGSPRRKSEIEKIDEEGRMSGSLRQLAMYSYLLRENQKWHADVRESRLEFVEAKNPKDFFYECVIQREDIELLKKDIMDYDRLVKSGAWVERECNYNSFGRGTECEYCKLKEIYK